MSTDFAGGRRLGWVPDSRKAAGAAPDLRAAGLIGSGTPPQKASARDLVPTVLNQGGLSSCTGFGVAQVVRGARILAGAPVGIEVPSPLWAYYLGRAYDHDTASDNGTQIRNVFRGIAKYGVCPESEWPYSDANGTDAPVFRMPPMSAFRAAYDWRGTYHSIDTHGRQRVDDIKRAIASRRLVCFGVEVSVPFCNNAFNPKAPLVAPISLDLAGGHCLVVTDYDGDDFGIVNSWGEGWGDGGYCRFSADYLAWGLASSFWICDSLPTVGGEA